MRSIKIGSCVNFGTHYIVSALSLRFVFFLNQQQQQQLQIHTPYFTAIKKIKKKKIINLNYATQKARKKKIGLRNLFLRLL